MKLLAGLVPTESTTKSSISHWKHWPRRKTVRKVQLWRRSSVQRVRYWSLVIEILHALSLWHCASLRLSAESSCSAAACGCNSIKDGRSYRITVSTSARLSSLWLKTSH